LQLLLPDPAHPRDGQDGRGQDHQDARGRDHLQVREARLRPLPPAHFAPSTSARKYAENFRLRSTVSSVPSPCFWAPIRSSVRKWLERSSSCTRPATWP